jgi:hypothetical protein
MPAGWLLLRRRPGKAWGLLAVPVAVFAAVQLSLPTFDALGGLPVAAQALAYGCSMFLPFVGSVVGGILAGRVAGTEPTRSA